jgi:anti-anti-sigma factor
MVGSDEQWEQSVGDGVTARWRATGGGGELEIVGELDGPAVERVRAAFPTSGVSRLVVDLSGVTFMGSSGINWLVGLRRQVDELLVRSPSSIVLRVLEITGVADVLTFVDEQPVPIDNR